MSALSAKFREQLIKVVPSPYKKSAKNFLKNLDKTLRLTPEQQIILLKTIALFLLQFPELPPWARELLQIIMTSKSEGIK